MPTLKKGEMYIFSSCFDLLLELSFRKLPFLDTACVFYILNDTNDGKTGKSNFKNIRIRIKKVISFISKKTSLEKKEMDHTTVNFLETE